MMPENYNEPFDPELNVSRGEILGQVQTILDAESNNRLISLVGSAGSGKSWLMSDLYLHLHSNSEHVLWLNLAERGQHPATGEDLPNCRTKDGRSAWLQQCIAETNQKIGEEIIAYNGNLPLPTMFSAYVQRVSEHYRPSKFFLLVDGFDEVIDDGELDFWQGQVFATFWQIEGECTHLLLARRDKQKLDHPILSWNEEVIPLPGFTLPERHSQLVLRSEKANLDPDLLQKALGDYFTPNPFLNTCLFEKVKAKETPDVEQEDIDACLELFMQRAGLASGSIILLYRLAQELPPEWTLRDLKQLTPPIRLEDPDMVTLFQAGIVQQIKGAPYYDLDDGVYQLLNTAVSQEDQNE